MESHWAFRKTVIFVVSSGYYIFLPTKQSRKFV